MARSFRDGWSSIWYSIFNMGGKQMSRQQMTEEEEQAFYEAMSPMPNEYDSFTIQRTTSDGMGGRIMTYEEDVYA